MTPPRPILRAGWAIHRALHRLSGGRLSTSPPTDQKPGTLFLVTRGRTSGHERRNGLFYIEDGTDYVVVASNAGADRDPGWWHNLQADATAQVEISGRTIAVTARQADEAEVARLWPRLDAVNHAYVAYRTRAKRTIPVVILVRR